MRRRNIKYRFIKKGIALSVFLMLLMTVHCQEDKKKIDNDYSKEFEAFKEDINQNFKSFRNKNDSIFKAFLEEAWTEMEVFVSEKKIKPKPVEQPVWDGKKDEGRELKIDEEKEVKQESNTPSKSGGTQEAEESPKEIAPTGLSVSIDFFGSLIDIPIDLKAEELGTTPIRTKQDIAGFYEVLSKNSQLSIVLDIVSQTASSRKLNGWGLVQLLAYVSDGLLSSQQQQLLFIWYGLLQYGTDARICLDGEKVILFVFTDSDLYNCSYITFNEKKYYLIDLFRDIEKLNRITTYDSQYPGELNQLKLMFTDTPVLTTKRHKRSVQFGEETFDLIANIPLIDFYSTYPECQLEVYFSAPLSNEAIDSWDKALGEEFINLPDINKVNQLLHVLQYAFPYKLDEKQFGEEKYMFADEALFYPFTDCEDRSVLLSQLVRHYTGLPVIGLDFPEHVAIGVSFKDNIPGDFVTFRGERYYICDPTYINAKVGLAMEGMKGMNNSKPNVIFVKSKLKSNPN